MAASFDVVGIGNAIVDVISHADESFLGRNGLVKGSMTLIDEARAAELYSRMGPGLEMSGGSAANTIAGVASLGGKGAFIGKVSDDQLGEVYAHDLRATGVAFATRPINGEPPTARSLIVVTEDAQRTMNTYLGACVELGPADIDEATIRAGKVTYLEGYLWDKPTAKEAFLKAAAIAHAAGRKVSLTLSDSFCVERHRDSFRDLVDGHVDVLFANEKEILALYQAKTLEAAIDAVRGSCEIIVITRSEKGSIVLYDGRAFDVAAEPVARVVDTTGAGDLYAGGFLYGLTAGRDPAECGRIGSIAAAEIISHYGARPETPLNRLVAERMAENPAS